MTAASAPHTPSQSMIRLASALFSDAADKERFLLALSSGDMARSAILHVHGVPGLPQGLPRADVPQPELSGDVTPAPPPWLPEWVSLANPDERPGLDPRHQAGEWYVLDLSSVFCATPLRDLAQQRQGDISRQRQKDTPLTLVDVCASPGGKALLGWRSLAPHLLIANEAIHGRIPALISNLKRCRIDPCVVLGRDPARLADELGRVADVVVVDAPCSGQSLLLKGKSSPGGFHPATVQMNSKRQRRILANASRLVKTFGYLLYSTCTFSRAENEGVIEWFLKRFPDFQSCVVPSLEKHRSSLSESDCYRLFPFEGFGAGGFTCLLRRSHETSAEVATTAGSGAHLEWNSARGREVFERLLRESASSQSQ